MTLTEVMANVGQKLRKSFRRGDERGPIMVRSNQLELLGDGERLTPAMDVYENDREILIVADVPGGTREGTTVAWDERRGLSFFVKAQSLPSGTQWASEYTPRNWYRALILPAYADGSKATASIEHGVLAVRVPKRVAPAKVIPVKAG